jgi:hypothetical protein
MAEPNNSQGLAGTQRYQLRYKLVFQGKQSWMIYLSQKASISSETSLTTKRRVPGMNPI